jgi:uncharacterized membrane protein YebE (DUF533 family)
MKDNFWTYSFGAIGALSGLAYLYYQHTQPNQAPVTNVFPPLNTSDPASTTSSEPVPVDETATVTQPVTGKQKVKTYPIYYT